jgi:N-acyl-D-aspartate/D-glutamate deacylase
VGAPADLVVLRDPQDVATHTCPDRYPEGVAAVVVDGALALVDGEPTGAGRGRVLRG